ncbi:MAG: hypothetical protein RL077_4447 [Verrucomicrobiota bacterium]|jgi:hypothetical protein
MKTPGKIIRIPFFKRTTLKTATSTHGEIGLGPSANEAGEWGFFVGENPAPRLRSEADAAPPLAR